MSFLGQTSKLPAGVLARLGEPRLLFPRSLERVSYDPGHALLLLSGEDLVIVHDLRSDEEASGGIETDCGAFLMTELRGGDLFVADRTSVDRTDARTAKPRARTHEPKEAIAAAVDAADTTLVCLEKSGRLDVLDSRSLKRRCSLDTPPVTDELSAEARVLLTARSELCLVLGADVRLVDPSSRQTLWTRPRSWGLGAAFAGDLVLLVERGPGAHGTPEQPTLRALRARTGEELWSAPLVSRERERRFPMSATGRGLFAVALFERVELRTVADGALVRELAVERARELRHESGLLLITAGRGAVAFSEDGSEPRSPLVPREGSERIAVRSGTVLVPEMAGAIAWRPGTDPARLPVRCFTAALSPDGRRLVARGEDQVLVAGIDGNVERRLPLSDTQLLAWGGEHVVALGLDSKLRVVHAGTGAEVIVVPAPAATAFELVASPGGEALALRLFQQPPRVLSLPRAERRPALDWPRAVKDADSISLVRRGEELFAAAGPCLYRFDTASGALLAKKELPLERATALAVSDDGRLVAVGSRDAGTAHLLRAEDGRELGRWSMPDGCSVFALAFLDERGSLLVSVSNGALLSMEPPRGALEAPVPARAKVLRAKKPRPKPAPRLRETRERTLPPPVGEGTLVARGDRASLVRGVRLGRLLVPTGRLAIGDPTDFPRVEPLKRRVPIGSHPVFAVMDQSDFFEPLAVFVQLSDNPIVRWSRAGVAGTDSAMLALADATTAAISFDDGREGELLTASTIAERSLGLGVSLIGGESRNIALFHTAADGGHAVDWGHDSSGKIAGLVVPRWFGEPDVTPLSLPNGPPPWGDFSALVPWALETFASAGERAPFTARALAEDELLFLVELAGVEAPEMALSFYQRASPLGLEAWPARCAKLREAGVAAFPLSVGESGLSDVVVANKGLPKVVTLGEDGRELARWYDVSAWLIQTGAQTLLWHRRPSG